MKSAPQHSGITATVPFYIDLMALRTANKLQPIWKTPHNILELQP